MQQIKFLLTGSFLLFLIACSKEQILSSDLENASANKTAATAQQQLVANANLEMLSNANLEMVPNELLVKFKKGTNVGARTKAITLLNAQIQEHLYTSAMKRSGDDQGVFLLRVNVNALEAIAKAKGLGDIAYAEPNWVYQHHAIYDDTYYNNGSLWGMYSIISSPANQYGSGAAIAWKSSTQRSEVYIGIIDEGYMFNHADLLANAGKNPGESLNPNDGIDNDGNGLIDDVNGWDFDGNNKTVFDGVGDDHGTHVAGTIGAVGGNGIGVAGVALNVKLLNAKFLGSRGGTTANAIKAVDYFTDLKNKGINIIATNNSWGGGGYSQALYDAISRANIGGVLFIAAAGNSGTNNDVTPSYPSNYNLPNVIAVASITSAGGLSSFSQYGSTSVDLGAPGSGIWSTVPKSSKGVIISGYASYNGTSMATPHVTGAAALYASSHPNATAAEIKAAILDAARLTPTTSLTGKCVTGGRLNVSTF